MARSNRNTRTSRTAAARPVVQERTETPVQKRRTITNYTFDYRRDRVSRRAGSSYFQIEGRNSGDTLTMSLQEAQSLYRFLQGALTDSQS